MRFITSDDINRIKESVSTADSFSKNNDLAERKVCSVCSLFLSYILPLDWKGHSFSPKPSHLLEYSQEEE
jgi:hypothetical protein